MLDEGLKIVEGLWSGDPFTFIGRHYRLQYALLLPSPAQTPRIPMWVAGGWPRRAPLRRAARWDGLYLMTEHQTTGDYLAPADIEEAADYLRLHGAREGFDIAFNPPPAAGAEAVCSYANAGATWWIQFEESGPHGYLRTIEAGPPVP